jgi:hypothetical protein
VAVDGGLNLDVVCAAGDMERDAVPLAVERRCGETVVLLQQRVMGRVAGGNEKVQLDCRRAVAGG